MSGAGNVTEERSTQTHCVWTLMTQGPQGQGAHPLVQAMASNMVPHLYV